MNRLSHILLLILLASSYPAIAQKGHELDDTGRFQFLKEYPYCGEYVIDKTSPEEFDSIPRIHFVDHANFAGVEFVDQKNLRVPIYYADFRVAKFESRTYFHRAQFDFRADFPFINCNSIVDFTMARFNSLANFSRADFYCAYFSNAQFQGIANFSGARFDSLARFYNTQFNSRAHFHETQFDSLANFSKAKFNTQAIFFKVQFRDEVDFTEVTLPDTLNFQEAKTKSEIDLTTTKLDSIKKAQGRFCLIDLRGAPINKFNLFYDNFRIYWPKDINPTKYERLTNVYEGLLKNFKDRGYLTSYATLDKEYHAFKDLQNPDASSIKKTLNKINYYWNNYGYTKERIWLWTLMFLAIATLFNWLAFPYLVKDVYPVPMIEKALFKGKLWRQKQFVGIPLLWNTIRLNFKHLRLAFFYTCLIFFGLKISTERINFEKYGGVTLIFMEYLVGLICLGYLANFIISSGLIGK